MTTLWRSTATLVSGATLARGLALVSLPVLSRLYAPSEFGILALYSSTVLVLAPFATLRYHVAIPLPRHDKSASAILFVCGAIAFGFTALLACVMLLGGGLIFGALSLEPLAPYAMLVPAGVLAASLFETMTMWATRRRAFKTIASTQVLQSFVGEGLKIALGFAEFGRVGLVVGYLSGHGSGVASYTWQSAKQIRYAFRGMSLKLVKLVAIRFRGFPLVRAPGQVLLALATQAPLFLVAANYDVSIAGQMAVAMLAFMTPFSLIGQAGGRAYFAEISRIGIRRPDLIKRELDRASWMLGLISTPIAAILFFFAEPAAALLLGQEWAQAGRFVSVLALALVPQFVSSTVLRTLDVMEAHLLIIALHASRLLVVTVAFSVAVAIGASPEQAILTFSLVLAAYHLVQNATIRLALNSARKVGL
ncbi:MAG: oligosaccharide flippase family protein [Pseudomonadota bacterium]